MSVIGVRLYYHYCPSVTRNLARFPKTVSDGDLGSLIPVVGKCVPNAFYSNNEGIEIIILCCCETDRLALSPRCGCESRV